MLEISEEEIVDRLARLRKLSVVEPFPARGKGAVNVHEAARLAIRSGLAAEREGLFRLLSARAAVFFAQDPTPAGSIEWIYHLLCADPESGANELEVLDRDWSGSAHPEDRSALASALGELEDGRLVDGRARAWVLLSMAWTRTSRGETSQLVGMAKRILRSAVVAADARAEADAHSLLGTAFEAQGKLGEAQAAYEQYLAIFQRLAEQDPSNAGWQRELAVAHSRVGGVFEAQGKLGEAQEAYEQYLAISRRLAEQDPSNAGWQRDLGVAYSRVGDAFEAQGKLGEALTAYEEAARVMRALSEAAPDSPQWKTERRLCERRRDSLRSRVSGG